MSPYFSPNSIMAPSVAGLVLRRLEDAHRAVVADHAVDLVLDGDELVRR